MAKSDLLGPGSLAIGPEGSLRQFATETRSTSLTPSTDTSDPLPTLDGGEVPGDDTDTFALSGSLLQSYDLDSLILWCFQNRGKVHPFTFYPKRAEGKFGWKGQVRIRALVTGGDVKTRNTSDFEFPVVGVPVPVDDDGTPIAAPA